MQLKQEQTGGRSHDVALVKFIWTFVRPYRRVFFLSVLLMEAILENVCCQVWK